MPWCRQLQQDVLFHQMLDFADKQKQLNSAKEVWKVTKGPTTSLIWPTLSGLAWSIRYKRQPLLIHHKGSMTRSHCLYLAGMHSPRNVFQERSASCCWYFAWGFYTWCRKCNTHHCLYRHCRSIALLCSWYLTALYCMWFLSLGLIRTASVQSFVCRLLWIYSPLLFICLWSVCYALLQLCVFCSLCSSVSLVWSLTAWFAAVPLLLLDYA